ncbi:hypothetical protein [Flammeovirga aprica]|uniref:Uncharacterized protein n=1 Tax=Flammeovirga aprica JL-4 TaxID=694437 RepID=A0A7X9RUM3_9BACT|nr:hypothetical protein [Flammeovirga aprica]NME69020.1 hypothetical protein [Flammeovirga aprica JL-4]
MTQRGSATRRANTLKRYKKIQQRFNDIYHSAPNGLKYDIHSIAEALADEFACAKSTIMHALKVKC